MTLNKAGAKWPEVSEVHCEITPYKLGDKFGGGRAIGIITGMQQSADQVRLGVAVARCGYHEDLLSCSKKGSVPLLGGKDRPPYEVRIEGRSWRWNKVNGADGVGATLHATIPSASIFDDEPLDLDPYTKFNLEVARVALCIVTCDMAESPTWPESVTEKIWNVGDLNKRYAELSSNVNIIH